MTEKLKQLFEFKISLGTIISVILYIVLGYAAFVELRTNHANLDKEFRQHEAYDDKRFEAFATKDTRAARDKEVDARLDIIVKQLDEANRRLERIERLHMRQ